MIDPADLIAMNQDQMIDLVLRLAQEPVQRPDGLRGAVRLVPLRLGHGLMQIINRQGEPIGPPFITAEGYYALALAAGFTIETPATVTIGDQQRPNPYIETSPETGDVSAVHVRKRFAGRNAAGDLVARDQTVVFSPWLYLMEELHRDMGAAVRGAAFTIGSRPEQGHMAYIPEVKLPGGVAIGMQVDATDDAVRNTLRRYAGRLKKAVEIAQTFCDRNGLRKALGVPACPPVHQGVAFIAVTSWHGAVDVESARTAGVMVEERTEMAAADVAQVAFEAADPDEGEAIDLREELERAAPTTPPPLPVADAMAAPSFAFEDDPLGWVNTMVDYGEHLRGRLGAAFDAICAKHGTCAREWANHGQETMRVIVAACEAAL